MDKNIVLYESDGLQLKVQVSPNQDTVWLTQDQMSQLFDRDRSVITKHITNIFKEGELDKKSNVQNLHIASSDKPILLYNLDVIISVGYRVKSKRGIDFRRWANKVLKDYILKGYAVNQHRMNQLNQAIQIMKRLESDLDTKQVLSVVEHYNTALSLLDDYDHQKITRPKGTLICT